MPTIAGPSRTPSGSGNRVSHSTRRMVRCSPLAGPAARNVKEANAANKTDLDRDSGIVKELRKKLPQPIHPISAVAGSGIKELTELLWQNVRG